MDLDGTHIAVLDAAPDAMLVCEADGRIVYANTQADRTFGYRPGALVGRTVDELVPSSSRATHARHRAAYLAAPTVRTMTQRGDLSGERADGSRFPVEVSLSPVEIAGDIFVIAAARDVSVRLAQDAERERSESEARQARALIDERERVARELHDTVIQQLFAAGLSLEATAGMVPEPACTRVTEAVDAIDGAIRELRSSIFALSSRRRGSDLAAELKGLVAEAARFLPRAPELTMTTDVVDRLGDETRAEVASVVRECLSNAVRHSHATRVGIEVTASSATDDDGDTVAAADQRLSIVVVDDGVGVDRSADAGGGGYGLVNLEQRAARLGGSMSVESGASGGTTVTWSVPLGTLVPGESRSPILE